MASNLVILGGAGLLGTAISRAAAKAGHQVVLADFDDNRGKRICQELSQSGLQASFFKCDVTSFDSILQLIDSSSAKYGQIDCVVNSTYLKGKGYGRRLPEVSVEDFCETISLQLGSLFRIYQAFSEYFVSAGGGSVISIGSIYGSLSPRFSLYANTEMTMPVEYAATKAALRHLNSYYAQFFKKKAVRFNIVSPGGIFNGQPSSFVNAYEEFSGTKGMLEPDDIVPAILYLASPQAQFITGQELIVDDGFSL